MRIVLGFLSIITMTQLSSCLNGCPIGTRTQRNLTAEIKKWASFKLGDEIVLENGSLFETVLVAFYREENESIILGDECPDGKMETISIKMTGNLFQDSILVRLEEEDNVILMYQDSELRFSEKTKRVRDNSSGSYHSTLMLNQRTFTDVLVLICYDSDNLEEIFIGKGVGLIAIQTKDGFWIRK